MNTSLGSNKTCLNIGAGKIDLNRYLNFSTVVHVDKYFHPAASMSIETLITEWPCSMISRCLCKSDIFEFVDLFPFKFDQVYAERIFEHMDYTAGEIGRLLEGLNVLTNKDATLEIVVPNAIKLSKMLLEYENTDDKVFTHISALNAKLIINTEFCNVRQDSHLSVWTPKLAHEYIESEGTWKIDKIDTDVTFAGRDIYMRIFCSKPQKNT